MLESSARPKAHGKPVLDHSGKGWSFVSGAKGRDEGCQECAPPRRSLREAHVKLNAKKAPRVLHDRLGADPDEQARLDCLLVKPLFLEDRREDLAEQLETEKADAPQPDDAGKAQGEPHESVVAPA